MLFTGWEVRILKNCDRGLENAARDCRPRAAFSSPRSQFFAIRTSQPVDNLLTNQIVGFVTVPAWKKIRGVMGVFFSFDNTCCQRR